MVTVAKCYKHKATLELARGVVVVGVEFMKATTVGEDSMEFKDEAKFEVGEKVLVFLTKEDPFTANIPPEHYRILSWKHGKFRLTEDGLAIRENFPSAYRVIPIQDIEKAIRKMMRTANKFFSNFISIASQPLKASPADKFQSPLALFPTTRLIAYEARR